MTRKQHSARPHRESVRKRLGKRRADAIARRDHGRCVYCGAHDGPMHLDHVVPRADGGTDEASNLVTACASCNSRKGSKTLRQFMALLRRDLGWSHRDTENACRRVRRHQRNG